MKILVVLWTYCTNCKILTGQRPFKLVYGKEAITPMEYIISNLHIAATIGMDDEASLKEGLEKLVPLEED